jgi:hypothetical protein
MAADKLAKAPIMATMIVVSMSIVINVIVYGE